MPKPPSNGVDDPLYNEVELPASVEIRESSVSAGQPGAFCKTLIKKDTRFGPYKGEIINPGQKADIDYRYAWEVFEKRRNVLKFTINALDPKTSNWMRNVNCARFYEEQNIVSTQEDFSIFYIAMKDIKAGEELLTWFDPQLLKRTQKRASRGERRKVGYTIELVPWSDEKKFVPEIIETKRSRKKKVLGEDMLSFEEDAALMQKSMNSMFRFPRRAESTHSLPNRHSLSSHHPVKVLHLPESKKVEPKVSPPIQIKREDKSNVKLLTSSVPPPSIRKENQDTIPIKPVGDIIKREPGIMLNEPVTKTNMSLEHNGKEVAMRKRRHRNRDKTHSVKNYVEKFIEDTKKVLDSTIGFNPDDPNLLKPVIIRTKDNGLVEMEDHDETYNISFANVRQECDDLCQCMDKKELLQQEHEVSSSVQKGKEEFVVRFTLLPEHQTFTSTNKVIYKCDICDSFYNHAFSLKRHYLGIHINHRYLSKKDIEHCQLETFHSGANAECFRDSIECENETSPLEQKASSVSSGSSLNDIENTKNDCVNKILSSNTSQESESLLENPKCLPKDNAQNLLCNEALLDSSSDETKNEIVTLSSLAQMQLDKNKSSLSSASLLVKGNNDVILQDSNHEKEQKILNELNEKMDCCENSSIKNLGKTNEKKDSDKDLSNKIAFQEEITDTSLNSKENKMCCENTENINQDGDSDEHGVSAEMISNTNKETFSQIKMRRAENVNQFEANSDSAIRDKSLSEVVVTQQSMNCTPKGDVDIKKTFVQNEKDEDFLKNHVESAMKAKPIDDLAKKKEQNDGANYDESTVKDKPNTKCLEKKEKEGNGGKIGEEEEKQLENEESVATVNLSNNEQEKLLDGNTEVLGKKSNEGKDQGNLEECLSEKDNAGNEDVEKTKGKTDSLGGNPPAESKPVPPSLVPIPTSLVQATSVNQAQQQFLLLVPIVSASTSSKSTTTTTPTLPQSQSGLPLVVISQVQTSTTNVHLQSSAVNPTLCPQILTNKSLPLLSTPSSASVQNFALISQNKSLISDVQSTTSPQPANSVVVASKPARPSSSVSEDTCQTLKSVKVKEADQPCDLYRCHMCVLVYKTMRELKYHIQNDPHRFKGGLKQYACPQCSVRFRNKTNLARHNLMHHQTSDDKDRKFRCLTCGKGFTTETYLKMHARFHLGKSFPCKYGCVDVYFPNAGSLVKHLRAVHPGLDLKGYLREKAQRERMKRLNMTNSEYSIDHPGVGFQAKRGRPKGSKNIPKEFKLLSANTIREGKMPLSIKTEPFSPLENQIPNRNYFSMEKSRLSPNCVPYQKDSNLPIESMQESLPVVQRKFNCKECDASFCSYLYLLKHRTKRHGATESVQEFLFKMTKDKEMESCSDSEMLQFSPPPSPKTFFANINQRGTENMSKYIEGGAEMLKRLKKAQLPVSTPPQLEWTLYNFPPCFRYVQDCTIFYPSSKQNLFARRIYKDDSEPKSGVSDIQGVVENIKDSTQNVDCNDKREQESKECVESQQGENKRDKGQESVNEDCTDLSKVQESYVSRNEKDKKNESKGLNSSSSLKEGIENFVQVIADQANIKSCQNHERSTSSNESHDLCSKNEVLISESAKELNNSIHASPAVGKAEMNESITEKWERVKKFHKRELIETQDILYRLNRYSLKALDLETGAKFSAKHVSSNEYSVLDSLNLITKEGLSKKLHHKLSANRKRKESFTSAHSYLLPSKKLCRSREQIFNSIFMNSSDISKHEPRRYSIWQGPNCNKEDSKACGQFSCPVVESVRQQNVMKRRKEICENNANEEIELKPKQKRKEEFAANIGLSSRREYERSYHVLEKKEHCIKPPEIWETYDRIWFGKKGTITVVCSICHRHFSCIELCLRHQLKKHPHIEPSSLEMERGNYVEDMYYYYPMPYGILAQTQLIPDKMPPPEVYVCSRCRFPFKNINKLHTHLVLCDPNNDTTSKNASMDEERKQENMLEGGTIDQNITVTQTHHRKHPRQRMLTSKFMNYQMHSRSSNFRDKSHCSSENKIMSRTPVPSFPTKSPHFINFTSGLPRRKRNQHGLLYNPSNHTRRRELYHVLDQHQCHGCNLKFKSMSMLERHVKNCSGKDKLQNQKPLLSGVADEVMLRKQHTCRYCNKRFTFIKGVDLHYKRICSVRKIREEENQLTAEDLAHEAELERIIEHMKWSKSLNKDSSDIIQGHVKVEEDGSLTRIDKKRGRPFGTGKRVKKKGFRWTTLKHHIHEETHSISSSEQSTPVSTPMIADDDSVKLSSSQDEKRFKESLEKALSNNIPKSAVDSTVKDEVTEEKSEEKRSSVSKLEIPTIPIPKKRGRPFKNRDASLIQSSVSQKRRRGRPKKGEEGMPQSEFAQEVRCLKDNINYKRGESTTKHIAVIKKHKVSEEKSPDTKITRLSYPGENYNVSSRQQDSKLSSNEHKEREKVNMSAVASRKRKMEETKVETETVVKPPNRVRGRPKKFDPSDMESSYKKKKKTDPGYVPLTRSVSRESPKNSSNTGVSEEDNTTDEQIQSDKRKDLSSSLMDKKDSENTADPRSNEEEEECKGSTDCSGSDNDWEKQNSKGPQSKESSSDSSDLKKVDKDAALKYHSENAARSKSPSRSFQITLEKSSDSLKITEKVTKDSPKDADKGAKEFAACKPSKSSNSPEDSNPPKKKFVIVKKRKKQNHSQNDSECKSAKGKETSKAIQSKSVPEESHKKSPKIIQSEEKATPAIKTQNISVTLSSASPKSDVVQTPVAVRIVTLPASAAQQLTSLGGMKIIKSPCASPSLSSKVVSTLSSSSSTSTTAVSSPVMKLAFTSPKCIIANKTQVCHEAGTSVMTQAITTTNTSTAKSPNSHTQILRPPLNSKSIIQSSAFPMAQVIPIENGNLLIPQQTVQTGVTPRFIIHSGPIKTTTVSVAKGPMKSPASGVSTSSTRHMAPSVILSSGKSVAGTVVSDSNMTLNSGQGKRVMKIGNVIHPVFNTANPSEPVFPSPPRPVLKKAKSPVNSPPSSTQGVTSPPGPLYYVQTSPLSNQVVMDISSLKTGEKAVHGMNAGNQVLLSLGDGKAKVMDTIAVPQLQFIPVSLVQGVSPNQGNTQRKKDPSGTSDEEHKEDGQAQEKEKL